MSYVFIGTALVLGIATLISWRLSNLANLAIRSILYGVGTTSLHVLLLLHGLAGVVGVILAFIGIHQATHLFLYPLAIVAVVLCGYMTGNLVYWVGCIKANHIRRR